MSYKITLEKFEGPLDLLLFLIKKNDIDICDIPIAEITDQYMEYIEMMRLLDLDVVGDFLVMAATLMQIKSRMLLPPDPLTGEQPDDPRNELVRRLQEYEQIKLLTQQLRDKEINRQDLFNRIVDQEALEAIKEDAKEVFIEATLFDLINALSEALRQKPTIVDYQISKEEFTVEGKITQLLEVLKDQEELSLAKLFTRCVNRNEVICVFIATLELVRLKEVLVIQRHQFDEIVLMRNASQQPA